MSTSRTRPPGAGADARRHEFVDLPLEQRFAGIFTTNLLTADSPSGLGSELMATAGVRQQLPGLLEAPGARSLLDLPCGDFGWLSRPDDVRHQGRRERQPSMATAITMIAPMMISWM